MSQTSEISNETVAAGYAANSLTTSITNFSTIRNKITTLIVQLSTNTTLLGYIDVMDNFLADRVAYLNNTSLIPPVTSFFYTVNNSTYGHIDIVNGSLDWTIYSSSQLGNSPYELLSDFVTAGPTTTRPVSTDGVVVDYDVYELYQKNATWKFITNYLWETPDDIPSIERGTRPCRGLNYALQSLNISVAFQSNQLGFEQSKQNYLSKLS